MQNDQFNSQYDEILKQNQSRKEVVDQVQQKYRETLN